MTAKSYGRFGVDWWGWAWKATQNGEMSLLTQQWSSPQSPGITGGSWVRVTITEAQPVETKEPTPWA